MTESGGIVPHAEFLPYKAEDGRARVEVRFDEETAWLTQAAMAALFQTTPQTISRHVSAYGEGGLDEGATCKCYVQVQTEGARRFYVEVEPGEEATTEDHSVVQSEGKRQVRRQFKHCNHVDSLREPRRGKEQAQLFRESVLGI